MADNQKMKKNIIYRVAGKKLVCVLRDSKTACLCPIVYKKNGGYSIKYSSAAVYSHEYTEFEPIAFIQDGSIYSFPVRKRSSQFIARIVVDGYCVVRE
jgi:hypothetical protein